MNIFVLSLDPYKAAEYQIDKHVTKMPLETAQLLCSIFKPGEAPYKRTHYNHPCAVWTRAARENAEWLISHGRGLGMEYTRRYGKDHKSVEVIEWCAANLDKAEFAGPRFTQFAQAMPEQYKHADPVAAYRAYYMGAKSEIATWKPPSSKPEWWTTEVTRG